MQYYKFLINLVIAIIFTNPSIANTFKIERWITKNKVSVAFYQAMEVPMLDISIAFAAGSAYDEDHFGLSALTAQMINEGSAGLNATQVAEQLAKNGSQFFIETSRDMSLFTLRTLTNNKAYQQATTTLTNMLTRPNFSSASFELMKKQQIMAIEQINQSPEDIATEQFLAHLYGKHPYAHPVNGTFSTVQELTRKQSVDFYKKYYTANNAILVLVGAIDSSEAHQLADKLTANLPQGAPLQPLDKAQPLKTAEAINIAFPSSQTIIRLGQVGIDHQDLNYFPLLVGNYILGGSNLTSELAEELREKRGLTYGIHSEIVPMSGKGPFLINFSTQHTQTKQAIQLAEQTLRLFIKNGPSEEELKAAKRYLIGSYPLSLASNRSIAALLSRILFYHLPSDYLDTYVAKINAVTITDIKKAFQQLIQPNKLLFITVGPS